MHHRTLTTTLVGLGLVLVHGACDPVGHLPGGNACVPGQSASCACADGQQGAQLCLEDGTYDDCVCGADPTQFVDGSLNDEDDKDVEDNQNGETGANGEPNGAEDPGATPPPPPPATGSPDAGVPPAAADAATQQDAFVPPAPPACETYNVVHGGGKELCEQTLSAWNQACAVLGCAWTGPNQCAVGGSPSNPVLFGAIGDCCCPAGGPACAGQGFNVATGVSQESCDLTLSGWAQMCQGLGCAWTGDTVCTIGGSPSSSTAFGAQGQCF